MQLLSTVLTITVAVVGAPAPSLQPATSLQLDARVAGEGRPVLLLGGGLLGADGWGDVPRILARTRRVINAQSVNVQYGLENRALPEGYSITTEVDAVRATLHGLGVADVDVIGMSHGGVVALAFALANPGAVRTLTLIEPPAFWVLPENGQDDPGAGEMQRLVASLRGVTITEAHLERFRCLLGDCGAGRSPRELPQWPQWVRYRNSLRGLYTVAEYREDPARLVGLRVPALIVTGAQTAAFHRRINEVLLRTLPLAVALDLRGGHNSPAAAPEEFVAEWQKFQARAGGERGQ